MATAETGQRRTDTVASTQLVVDMHKPILELEPDAAPITVILKQIMNGGRRRPARNTEFKWHNSELEGRFDAVNNGAGYTSANTSIVVDTGGLFDAGYLVKVPRTGELLYVVSVSTNTLTVTRAAGGTTAAALVDNDPLYIVGAAREEGYTSPSARAIDPTAVSNYTQIFRRAVEQSGSAMSVDNESEPHDWTWQRKNQGIEHLKDIELAMIYGGASSDVGSAAASGKRRSTGGILSFATSNNQDAGGTLTEAELEQFLRSVFRYGSQSRTLFASALVVSVLNQFSQGKLQTFVGDDTYGVKVMNWVSPHGEVKIVKHNLLEGTTYGGYAIALDLERQNIAYRYLAGGPGGSRDTKLLVNRQTPDKDGQKDEYLTECGLQFGLPSLAGVLYGVTG